MSWFKKLKTGLSKSSNSIGEGISSIFTKKKLDADTLEELEDLLIMSDMGASVASSITQELAKEKFNKDIDDSEIKQFLGQKISNILSPVATPLIISQKPQVIMLCGVNGNGKTTTLGKLAAKYQSEGKKVLIAACDTFRAAAVEQLEVWADRSNCTLIKGELNSDPASVAYKAVHKAYDENYDIIMIDTAGRLHNKKNLMDELTKINSVIKKIDETAPHNSILVLDATTGQNALLQAENFTKLIGINGLILTKLDGTAKGGITVAIANKFKLPIHAVGVGESIDDLDQFDPEEFAKALLNN